MGMETGFLTRRKTDFVNLDAGEGTCSGIGCEQMLT